MLELVIRLNQESFHVCLDTSGFASQKLFEQIIPYTDLFHFDIKSFDSETHKAHTGVKNDVIFSNLDFIASHDKNIILRCPIIPGVNAQDKHFLEIAELANKYTSITKIDLLPYHKMGVKKACNLNSSTNQIFETSSDTDKQNWKKLVESHATKQVYLGL